MRYIRTKDRIIDLNRTYLDGSPIYNLDTKENVIKANENGEERDCYYIENDTIYGYWYSDGCIWDEHIIDQADTIEELCDGFIGIGTREYPGRPDIEPFIHYFQKPFEFMYGNNTIKHLKLIDVELKNQNGWSYPAKEWFETCDIYGFIRTYKGLIYAAKMNDKGDLELICL